MTLILIHDLVYVKEVSFTESVIKFVNTHLVNVICNIILGTMFMNRQFCDTQQENSFYTISNNVFIEEFK